METAGWGAVEVGVAAWILKGRGARAVRRADASPSAAVLAGRPSVGPVGQASVGPAGQVWVEPAGRVWADFRGLLLVVVRA